MLDKYNEIWMWLKINYILNFIACLLRNKKYKKYLRTKVREYDEVIKTNFLSNGVPKENMHYTCIACITIDSVMRMEKKNYP